MGAQGEGGAPWTLLATVGLPYAGKTTWARHQAKAFGTPIVCPAQAVAEEGEWAVAWMPDGYVALRPPFGEWRVIPARVLEDVREVRHG